MHEHDEYESEFQAPQYSIIEKRMVGSKVITTAIIDGEIAVFEADRQTVTEAMQLKDERLSECAGKLYAQRD